MIFNPVPSQQDRKVRVFSLAQSFLDSFKDTQPQWGPVGYFTYKRTYSRPTADGVSTEEWWQTCQRVVEGCFNIQKIHCRMYGLPWNESKAQKSAQEMYRRIFTFKFTPPGRGLWVMGTDLIYEKGSAALQNCAFVSTKDIDEDFASPFTFLMDMSMLGVGVGGDCRGAGKVKLSVPKFSSETFVVEDSREGWVELLRTVLNAFVGRGAYPLVVDYSKVRPMGTPIKGFGGIASGPGPLKQMIEGISRILMPAGVEMAFERVAWEPIYALGTGDVREAVNLDDKRDAIRVYLTAGAETVQSSRITSTQIVDVFNYIGKCVVAGGVRRTAEIMFGEASDNDFMTMKSDETLRPLYERKAKLLKYGADGFVDMLDPDAFLSPEEQQRVLAEIEEQINAHPIVDRRWASNNSIFGHVGMDYTAAAEAVARNGEPGVFWIENARAYGRMADPPDWRDDRVMGTNPCGEQSLESFELCNLVETYPAHHDSLEDFKITLKMAYLYAKTVTLVPTHDPRANSVMLRNRRIGCSMSGIVQALTKVGYREFLHWCDDGYKEIRRLDKVYSEWLGVPESKKTTSIKPSGTVSLLCGATPGIHYPESEFYLRRIRVVASSPLVKMAQDAGYPVEPDRYAGNTMTVTFPVREALFAKSKKDVSIWEQFALAAAIQRYWADNQVSVTVTFNSQEAAEIKRCLEVFETQLKSVSLLPVSDHGYDQAPYEEIDEATYNALMANISPMDFSMAGNTHDASSEEKFCSNDVCELRLPGA